MSKPITKELFQNWEKISNEAAGLENQILNRISEVLDIWFSAFGGRVNIWYFNGASEGFTGNLDDNVRSDTIHSIIVDCRPDPAPNYSYDMVILDKNGFEWHWDGSIPKRWLFEDCTDEIVNGKDLFEKAQAEKNVATEAKKTVNKMLNAELVAKAKLKLTTEELDALKKSL